jgi:hypothetical protein
MDGCNLQHIPRGREQSYYYIHIVSQFTVHGAPKPNHMHALAALAVVVQSSGHGYCSQ